MAERYLHSVTMSPKNRLSLNFTLWNMENVTISIQKTIAAHAWMHLPF